MPHRPLILVGWCLLLVTYALVAVVLVISSTNIMLVLRTWVSRSIFVLVSNRSGGRG